MNWDKRFIEMAREISTWSKDPSKQIGAIAVGPKRNVLSTGYNGFPRGIEDYESRYIDRPTKYKYIVHAEQNVIYNATYNGVSLDGSTLYVYGLPVCSECAKGIIQVGIQRVVYCAEDVPEKWQQSLLLTQEMFAETGLQFDQIVL
jgi:dCMP deaminase